MYNKLNSDRSSLLDEKRNDGTITPPFFWHHIRPERRRQAIIDTWQQAKPGTIQRTLFDLGATNGEHAPNWVTLWLLYSVFRSRDIRNNRNRRTGEGSGGVYPLSSSLSCWPIVTNANPPSQEQVRTPRLRIPQSSILPETNMSGVDMNEKDGPHVRGDLKQVQ